jgi:hypothetical protein
VPFGSGLKLDRDLRFPGGTDFTSLTCAGFEAADPFVKATSVDYDILKHHGCVIDHFEIRSAIACKDENGNSSNSNIAPRPVHLRLGPAQPNGSTLSRANRTRNRSTYDDEAAVGVGCSVELDDGHRTEPTGVLRATYAVERYRAERTVDENNGPQPRRRDDSQDVKGRVGVRAKLGP